MNAYEAAIQLADRGDLDTAEKAWARYRRDTKPTYDQWTNVEQAFKAAREEFLTHGNDSTGRLCRDLSLFGLTPFVADDWELPEYDGARFISYADCRHEEDAGSEWTNRLDYDPTI